MIGGALIGKGSFGCVFKPSLKCPGERGGKDDIVSKVFFSEGSKDFGTCSILQHSALSVENGIA